VRTTLGRLELAIGLVIGVLVVGTLGYWGFGLEPLDAFYQTITTVTTVGFQEVEQFGTSERLFTSFIILTGVGAVLYGFTLIVQMVVEGELRDVFGRRRMQRDIERMSGHTVVCGWGRVGRAVATDLAAAGHQVVVVDMNGERLVDCPYPTVIGDATLDATLASAGIARARALIAALEGDAENLFVTLSGRAIEPSLFIVARARQDESIPKLENAGADRVVNPQELGAARMASFVVRPHVAEFVDVVMHERSLEFRMQEVEIGPDSPLAGRTLRESDIRERSGVLVLAIREPDGTFTTNPTGDTIIEPKQVVIAVGTNDDFERLAEVTRID
jgi:voltage-gated potassium channel